MAKSNGNTGTVVLGIAFIICLLIVIGIFQQNGAKEYDTLTVTGNAELSFVPDIAYVYASVLTEAETATDAQEKNSKLSGSLMLALNGYKVESDNYNLYPKYDYTKETGESQIYAYVAEHVVKITVEDVANVGNVVDLVINSGANKINRVNFDLEDVDEVRNDILEKAGEMAEKKAKAMSKAMDVKLKGIKSISEANYYYQPFIARAEMASADFKMAPEEVQVSASLNVVYKIK
jgi:uncharacterized protein